MIQTVEPTQQIPISLRPPGLLTQQHPEGFLEVCQRRGQPHLGWGNGVPQSGCHGRKGLPPRCPQM